MTYLEMYWNTTSILIPCLKTEWDPSWIYHPASHPLLSIKQPLAWSCLTSTTTTRAIPHSKVAQITQQHELWMHMDCSCFPSWMLLNMRHCTQNPQFQQKIGPSIKQDNIKAQIAWTSWMLPCSYCNSTLASRNPQFPQQIRWNTRTIPHKILHLSYLLGPWR